MPTIKAKGNILYAAGKLSLIKLDFERELPQRVSRSPF